MITAEQLLDNTSHMDWLNKSQKMLVEAMMETYKEITLEEVKNNAPLHSVSNQRELLIATLKGWEGYKNDGVECTVEEYVAEVESNL